jgi:hypothetical protein
MEDYVVNTILIFDLPMTNTSMHNNYRNKEFKMQKSEDNLSRIFTKSTKIFAQSLGVFAQPSNLLAQTTKKLV